MQLGANAKAGAIRESQRGGGERTFGGLFRVFRVARIGSRFACPLDECGIDGALIVGVPMVGAPEERQSNSSPNGPALAVALDRLGFHVDRSGESRTRAAGARISLVNHVGGQRNCVAVGESGKSRIFGRASADLNQKRAEQEPGGERECLGQPRSLPKEPQT